MCSEVQRREGVKAGLLETIYSTFFVFITCIFVNYICLACIVVILCVFVYHICICCTLCVFVVLYVYLLYLCVFVVLLCVFVVPYAYLLYYVCIAVLTLDAGLLARSQYPEGPATGHLDTGFSWFPCVYKRMLR